MGLSLRIGSLYPAVTPGELRHSAISPKQPGSYSRPVLLADKVNIAEEIADDGAGLMELDTPDGTLRLLKRWIAMSADEKQAMSDRAYKCFHKRYDMSENAKAIIRLFEHAGDQVAVP